MKIPNEFKILVAFFCVCLIYHIDGLPRHHHNSTAWNNSGRHNATHHRPSHMIGYQNHTNPNNWQPYHRPNQTIDHQNHTNPNNWYPHHRPGRPWQNNHHSHRRNWTQNIPISLPQVNNGSNSYPTWHAGLPGSTLVAGTHIENTLPLSNYAGNRGIGFNLGPQLTPLAGSASGHKNTVNGGWNFPNGQLNGTYRAHPY
ncbi:uncharacterized histidine-rich protein DDB_G0274557-like [Bactrocera tryoni]|uniref:uncharacterized histidine-rich protein DDB_G0274557-like n=1 Tax=Bactrocera tryoni TaxID=59916 RepID=UPI001A993C82|nr:uncharacterized histidine-rich protein DDB_G0274557-like [Bactrocera tryoni]